MTAQQGRPTIPKAVGQNRSRIEILEAVRPEVCYAFLDEYVSVAGDRTMAITGISQDYRHLAVEIQVSALLGLETPPANPADIWVNFALDYMFSPQQLYADPVEPTTPVATKSTVDENYVVMKKTMTFSDLAVFDGPGYVSYATMKIPYYRESVWAVGGVWSAVAFGTLTVTGDTDYGAVHNTGGFVGSPLYNGPITEITVECSRRPFLVNRGAYNGATVYVAGDYVTYLGQAYISIAGSTGVAPVPPGGGASWLNYRRDLTTGSRISVYGVC